MDATERLAFCGKRKLKTMALDLADYERKAATAVRKFWKNREAARRRQIDSGRIDQGERAGVTAGKNMDGFLDLASILFAKTT